MLDISWEKLSIIGLLGAIIIALVRGSVVPGYLYERLIKKNDEYDTVIASQRSTIEKLVGLLDDYKRSKKR